MLHPFIIILITTTFLLASYADYDKEIQDILLSSNKEVSLIYTILNGRSSSIAFSYANMRDDIAQQACCNVCLVVDE